MFGSQLFAWLLLQVVFLLWYREAARAADAWWASPHRHQWWERECKHETCLQNILHFFFMRWQNPNLMSLYSLNTNLIKMLFSISFGSNPAIVLP